MIADRICAWCGRLLGTCETSDGKPSHGICDLCAAKWRQEAKAKENVRLLFLGPQVFFSFLSLRQRRRLSSGGPSGFLWFVFLFCVVPAVNLNLNL